MVDRESLKIFSDALHEGIVLFRYGIPIETFHYENWERTLAEELSLDGFLFKRNDPLERARYVTGSSRASCSRHDK
jgi:hypothetical protein